MLDMNTGRFTWGEGLELYPGMSREDFLKSRVFENELLHEEDKLDIKGRRFDLRDIPNVEVKITYKNFGKGA